LTGPRPHNDRFCRNAAYWNDTLLLFGSEFGRLPMGQGVDGRDHNITGAISFSQEPE
jgi:uncharacterized protein (DUF1501 family)